MLQGGFIMIVKRRKAPVFFLSFLLVFFPLQVVAAFPLLNEEVFSLQFFHALLRAGPLERTERIVHTAPLKKVALTFDDGPDQVNTPEILSILERENVLATFFVIGQRVEQYPEIIKCIFADGHLLANHSRSHVDLSTLSNEDIVDLELDPTSKAVEDITGFYPKIMRPPYGSLRADSLPFLQQAGWHVIRWTLDTFDWDKTRNKPEEIVERINLGHHPNAIILMHCNGRETIAALPDVIQSLKTLGYGFVTISQLLNLES